MTIKPFQLEKHAELVHGWAVAHGREDGLLTDLLPPDGIVVYEDDEPIAACWLYLACGVGVGWIDHFHTRPKMKPSEAQVAIEFMVSAFRDIAAANDYGTIYTHTHLAIARRAVKSGWIPVNTGMVQMWIPTGKEAA